MRYAVVSDIHGNFEAFKEVLKYLEKENIDIIVNCGDIVGYGPEPDICVNTIKQLKNAVSVLGNHDITVAAYSGKSAFNTRALTAAGWTRDRLSSENIKFLLSLEKKKSISDFIFLHGSPRAPLNEYILGVETAEINFRKLFKSLCFVGHTHRPAVFRRTPGNEVETPVFYPGDDIKLEDSSWYIINPGSVGQPRDGNPDSSFIIYDSDKMTVSLRRVSYDIVKTQNLILNAGLPEYLAARLAEGE